MNVISRAGWGARPPRSGIESVPMRERTEFIVHHSQGPADQSVRAIQDWCMDGRGYLDIDYNWLVRGTTGQIYTGRGWLAVGAHTLGHNTQGLGVCVIGYDELSAAAKESLRWLYAEAVRFAGHSLEVKGHRDLAPTDCPGDVIYAWVHAGNVQRSAVAGHDFRTLWLASPLQHGEDVRLVQLKVGAAADGIYGPLTAAKVRAWQQAHGLVADGVVGPLTRAAMGIH